LVCPPRPFTVFSFYWNCTFLLSSLLLCFHPSLWSCSLSRRTSELRLPLSVQNHS
jgi:hypothetical protein